MTAALLVVVVVLAAVAAAVASDRPPRKPRKPRPPPKVESVKRMERRANAKLEDPIRLVTFRVQSGRTTLALVDLGLLDWDSADHWPSVEAAAARFFREELIERDEG